jgi:polysaccharide biosynthesis transport protein
MSQSSEESSLDVSGYLRIARNKWRSIVAVALFGGLASLVWTVRQPKVFESTCSVIIEPIAPQVLSGMKDVVELGAGGGYWATREFYETQYKIIRSRDAILQVVDQLGLADDETLVPRNVTQDRRRDTAARMVFTNSRVVPVKDSRIANIAVTSLDPKKAAQMANALSLVYIERNLDHKVESSRTATTWLGDQTVAIAKNLRGSELALYEFRRKNQLLESDLEVKLGMTTRNLETYNLKLADLRAQRLEIESTRKIIAQIGGPATTRETIPIVRDNEVIQQLRLSFFELSKIKAELESKYGEKHPRIEALQGQIDKLGKNFQREIDNILAALEAKYSTTLENEKALVRLMDGEKKAAIDLAKLDVEYKPLAREAQTNGKLYEMITQREKETALTGLVRSNNVRILDSAIPVGVPISPRPVVNITLGTFVGLIIGLAFALSTELLDRTLRTQEQVEEATGFPVIGLVPVIGGREKRKLNTGELQDRDLLVFRDSKSSVAEACRGIRTNLLFMSPDKPIKAFTITSPGPQEGKTTTAISLAITLSQPGKRVLLVDTDLRRPRIHRSFGLTNLNGVSSCIVGESELSAAVVQTEVPNLFVLTSGPIPPNPAELLHTVKFSNLIAECRANYDFVIFDAPPISAVTDPAIIANLTDGVVLVARAGHTTKDALAYARRQLSDAKAQIIGTIVNRVDLSSRRYAYHYARYYRDYSSGAYGSRENAVQS